MSKNTELQDRFFDVVSSNKAYTNRYRLEQHLDYMFRGVRLAGKRVLDVGGGTGLLTLWAAVAGAEAVCLEPESDGSSQNMRQVFESLKSQIQGGIKASGSSRFVQEYLAQTGDKFDVIMMANCINHIDEENCANLQENESARRVYVEFFQMVKAHLNPGGKLIITDCARRNFFGDLGIKSPIVPWIEWHIHQSPALWRNLMEQAEFSVGGTKWTSPNSFGPVGRTLLGNRAVAYFLLSHFRLMATA